MALEIFKLIGSVFVDTDEAEKSLKKTDKTAGGLGTTLVNGAKTVGKFAVGFAGAAAAAGGALMAVAESTREYRAEMGKLQAAFTDVGHSTEAATTTYQTLNSVLGDTGQAVEASNHLALLCDDEEQLATMTEAMTGIYATFGASLPLEGLAEAANETAKVGQVTGGLADALNWADVSMTRWSGILEDNVGAQAAFNEAAAEGASVEDAFNAALAACATEQERAALITDALSGAYQEQAFIYQDLNADIINANMAQENMNAAMAGIGAAVEPFITAGKMLIADVLTKLTPVLTNLASFVIPLVTGAIATVSDWVTNLTGRLSNSGITFQGVMTTAKTLFQNAMTIIQTIWTSVGQPTWDFIMQAVNLVKDLFMRNMPAIKAFVQSAFTDIKNIWQNNLQPALQAIGNFIQNVLAPAFKFVFNNVIAPVVETAFKGIKNLWNNTLRPVLQGILDFITGVFTLNFSKAFSGLVTAVKGVFSGLVNVVKTPINAVISVVNSFIRGLNKLKVPDWVPGVGGKGINIPTIPQLEQGGILERGQMGFLEGSGAEAVVPLHQNKQWISAVARDMDAAMGGASGSRVVALLADILNTLEDLANAGIYLDSDALVGGLARKMDNRLGQLQAKKARA